MRYNRYTKTFECYNKLRKTLSRDGTERKYQQLLEYGRNNDVRFLSNCIFKTEKTYIGYGTEKRNKYAQLNSNDKYNHIVHTDRGTVPDIQTIKGAQKMFQIEDIVGLNAENKWMFRSASKPCSCHSCCLSSSSISCCYHAEKNIKEHFARRRDASEKNHTDGISKLTIKLLRVELEGRWLSKKGLKKKLVSQLCAALQDAEE